MNRPALCVAATLLATVWFSVGAHSELVVIYDSGRSWPIDRYLVPIVPRYPTGPVADIDQENAPPQSLNLASLLSIRSKELSPGRVEPRDFASPVPLAFFLIGADTGSLRWLVRHRDYLKARGAIGLLVEADDSDAIKAVADAAAGLPIAPASGDDIARLLDVRHYPVAVTEGRIWQ